MNGGEVGSVLSWTFFWSVCVGGL